MTLLLVLLVLILEFLLLRRYWRRSDDQFLTGEDRMTAAIALLFLTIIFGAGDLVLLVLQFRA